MRPKVAILFKMKSKPVEELRKYADVDFILYPSVDELKERIGGVRRRHNLAAEQVPARGDRESRKA